MTEIRSLHGATVAEVFAFGLDNPDRIEAIYFGGLYRMVVAERREPGEIH